MIRGVPFLLLISSTCSLQSFLPCVWCLRRKPRSKFLMESFSADTAPTTCSLAQGDVASRSFWRVFHCLTA
uniref:Uncharacterized protein n=1 Tax=Arundo donax TaxID=35708 RepID=A0A0A8XVA0_ARUDO